MGEHRALSIRQPWADLVLAGHKTVENRTWATPFRGRIVVHAGKAADTEGWIHALNADCAEAFDTSRRGALLGSVEVRGVHPATGRCCQPWGNQSGFHWVVAAAHRFEVPVPLAGKLGLFTVPDGALEATAPPVRDDRGRRL